MLRIFSPDGLVVNKLNQLDKLSDRTFRSFRWDANNVSTGDQVIEFASEHACQGKPIFALNQ
jgi:phosphoketolase